MAADRTGKGAVPRLISEVAVSGIGVYCLPPRSTTCEGERVLARGSARPEAQQHAAARRTARIFEAGPRGFKVVSKW